MAFQLTQILMPFYPLLITIIKSLGFPRPKFEFLDIEKNNVMVSIKTDVGPVAYTYIGGEAESVEISAERAAQKAVLSLMVKFDVYVEDMTSIQRQETERCIAMYQLKQLELKRIEKGKSRVGLYENLLGETCGYSRVVSVDFLTILRVVCHRFQIRSTTLETVQHNPKSYTAWFTVSLPTHMLSPKCFFSDRRSTLTGAKQNLAKKVLNYLMPMYNFEVVDANYNPEKAKYRAIVCALQRESYLTLKERVLGIREEVEPSELLVEQDCLTPKATPYKIPHTSTLPLPPKKRRVQLSEGSSSVVTESTSNNAVFSIDLPKTDIKIRRTKSV